MSEVVWVPVKVWKNGVLFDYTGKYEANNKGEVRSLNWRGSSSPRIMCPQNNGHNYLFVGLRNGDKKQQFYVHRIVWESFNGKIPENYEINHKDCNSLNNSLENVEIVTRKENLNWGEHSARQKESQKNNKKTSKPVKQLDLDGNLVKVYKSQMDAHRQTGIPSSNICLCVNGKLKTAGGFTWCQ